MFIFTKYWGYKQLRPSLHLTLWGGPSLLSPLNIRLWNEDVISSLAMDQKLWERIL